MAKIDNNLLTRKFVDDPYQAIRDEFGFTRKTRMVRMGEIFDIMRKHNVFKADFTPSLLREILEDLGPSFIKIGQMLSLRSEILPQSYCDELTSLQTSCPPVPFETIVETLKGTYGDQFDKIFESIYPQPLGSASLAQVHKGVLTSGEVVAIKVRRPGVREALAQDIDVMRSIVRHTERFMKETMLDLGDVVEELWTMVTDECDFLKEAANLREFQLLNKDVAFIRCPKPYLEYSTSNVLVMEYVDGIPIRDHDALVKGGYDLEEIGEKILDNYATQILDHGFFHADPHPGNIVIDGGQVVYLDLGMMGRLSARDRTTFGQIIKAVASQSASDLKDALLSFAVDRDLEAIDHSQLLASMDMVLSSYSAVNVQDIDIGALLTDIMAVTQECKVILPSSVTEVGRGIVTIEGTLQEYIANTSILAIINDHMRRNTDVKEEAQRLAWDAATSLYTATKGMAKTAEYSGEAMRMLTRGQLRMNMEMLSSDELLKKFSHVMNRFAIGIIIAGLLVSASLIINVNMPAVGGMPILSVVMYVVALVLLVMVILDIYRPRK